MLNCKGFWRKRSWPNRGTSPAFHGNMGANTKHDRTFGAPAEVRIEYFLNTSPKRYRYAILLCVMTLLDGSQFLSTFIFSFSPSGLCQLTQHTCRYVITYTKATEINHMDQPPPHLPLGVFLPPPLHFTMFPFSCLIFPFTGLLVVITTWYFSRGQAL
jgi:hypothetical protein